MAVEGKSTITDRRSTGSSGGNEGTKVKEVRTEEGENTDGNSCTTLDDLFPVSTAVFAIDAPIERTNIQDHANNPAVPSMKEIPYDNKPENAPDMVAAPRNNPIRYWSL